MSTYPTKRFFLLLFLFLQYFCSNAQLSEGKVYHIGAMRNVMWKGELFGTIDLDSLKGIAGLYGVGPIEGLAGELLIADGECFQSRVVSESEMKVTASFDAKAPFFVYSVVNEWKSFDIPEEVRDMRAIELFLDSITIKASRPFVFRIEGIAESGSIHVVNLAPGSKVSNPDEAHQGQINYPLNNEAVEITGFFSTEHQAVFTHHDTFMHMHLNTPNRKKMGHIDSLRLAPGSWKLWLPMSIF